MADNIIDYLEAYGDVSFAEMPMNDVDSLVLCQLSYLKFDGIVSDVRENGHPITLMQISEHIDYENLYADERYEKPNRALFEAMVAGKRYANMYLNCYINMVEIEREFQFSAITFMPENAPVYIAFRGTDETLIGWKEDFNMAFSAPIPGQEYSVKYLNMVGGKLRRPFIVGGHSKGGNLAIYSSMKCSPVVQDRILKIYNMDGPGFRPEILAECDYSKIEERVEKILPHSSLVGMIFESDNIRCRVVKSNTVGVLQHNPYTWIVEDNAFVECEDIERHSKLMDSNMNEWILSLNKEQLHVFVDTLYQVISASQAQDLIEFTGEWKRSMNGMLNALKDVDDEAKDVLKSVTKSLRDFTKVRMREEVAKEFTQYRFKHRKKKQEIVEEK